MKDVDPVDELHRIRQQICKKAGGTPAAYVRYYLEMDREKVAALKAAGAETVMPASASSVQGKRGRKSAKPAARASTRKPEARRKAVTA